VTPDIMTLAKPLAGVFPPERQQGKGHFLSLASLLLLETQCSHEAEVKVLCLLFGLAC